MNPILSETLAEVSAVSWRTGVVIVGLALVRRAVRGRIPAQVWFAVWVVVALRLLLPYSISTAWSPFNLVPSGRVTVAPAAERPASAAGGVAVEKRTVEAGAVRAAVHEAVAVGSAWTWREYALGAWMSGVGLLAGLRFVVAAKFRWRLRSARRCEDQRWLAIVADEARVWGWDEAVICLETEAVDAPALGGWFRPQLLIPPGFAAKLTDDELRWVVRHELGHWRRRDLVAQRLMQAAVVVHWFNPLVWLAARLARVDCELACDEFVLRRPTAGGGEAYGATLLKVLGVVRERRRPLAVVGILETRRQLAERIRLIASHRRAGLGGVMGGVLVIAVVAAVSGTREMHAAVVPAVVEVKPSVSAAKENSSAGAEEQTRIKEEVRARIEASWRAYTALNKTVDAQKSKVEQLAEQLYDYKKKHNLLSLDERAKLMEGKLGPARFAVFRSEKEWEEAKSEAARAAPAGKVEAEAAVASARRNMEQAQTELEWLNAEAAQIARAQTVLPQLERDLKSQEQVLQEIVKRSRGELETIFARSPQALERLRADPAAAVVEPKAALQEASRTAAPRFVNAAEAQPAAPASVMVMGAVGSPTALSPLASDGQRLGLAELISRAGYFTRKADQAHVRLTRYDAKTGATKVFVFDVPGLARNRASMADASFVVEPGDIIFVPEKLP